jgi:hypothetical protein
MTDPNGGEWSMPISDKHLLQLMESTKVKADPVPEAVKVIHGEPRVADRLRGRRFDIGVKRLANWSGTFVSQYDHRRRW